MNVTTNGGEATNNEMCFNMLLYYPKADIAGCVSMLLLPVRQLIVTGYVTQGCNCTGPNSCNESDCRVIKGVCSNHLNCSTCSAGNALGVTYN
jgi:hypothetical protein